MALPTAAIWGFVFAEDDAACGGAFDERVDGVGAGEDEPVVGVEVAEGGIERIVAGWRLDFEDGDFDGFGSGGAKTFAEFAGLVSGAGDEDAFVGEGVMLIEYSFGTIGRPSGAPLGELIYSPGFTGDILELPLRGILHANAQDDSG